MINIMSEFLNVAWKEWLKLGLGGELFQLFGQVDQCFQILFLILLKVNLVIML